MMLSNLPLNNNRSPNTGPNAQPPLHERLFGEHSKWFYIWIIGSLAFVLAELALRPLPKMLENFGALSGPLFLLLIGSPDPRIRAVVFGMLCGLLWSEAEFEPLTAVPVALAAILVYLAATKVTARIRVRIALMTRRERKPLVALLTAMELGQAVFFLAPASLIVYGYLAGRGAHPVDAQLLIGAGVGLWLVMMIRQLWNDLPAPADA
jgi:hypothetical protein